MSITIDTNLVYLQSRLQLSAEKMQIYRGMSVEEVLKAEASEGNQLAIELAEELLTNVNLLIELFRLADAENKYAILMNMSQDDLIKLLPLLEKDDMLQGLMYFNQDKLLDFLKHIPPEQLVKTVMELFSEEQIINLMPEEQLDKLLTSFEVDKYRILDNMKSLPPEYLAQVIESVTGKPCQAQNGIEMVDTISEFNPLEFRDSLTNLATLPKQQLTLALTKEDKKLYQLFDADAYTNMIDNHYKKPDIVRAMSVIEPEEILKMVQQLPKDLMSIVITQLDTQDFAENLMNEHPELIAQMLV